MKELARRVRELARLSEADPARRQELRREFLAAYRRDSQATFTQIEGQIRESLGTELLTGNQRERLAQLLLGWPSA